MMAIARTLLRLNDLRELYLYDTFQGMSEPTVHDKDVKGKSASKLLASAPRDDSVWAFAHLEGVKQAMAQTGYDPARVHFCEGKVEDTIPNTIPDQISLLRLDTDWYESTRHELNHLFPRLARNGVLIIDDYGHWQGARRAVDEYFSGNVPPILLNVIDYTGRIGIKTT